MAIPTGSSASPQQDAPIPGAATSVTASRFVLDGWPVHTVVHERSGRWRALGEQAVHPADDRPTPWATLGDLDPTLSSLPPLPPGTLAHRSFRGGPWVVVPG